jgi:hypothetical protein
LHSDWARGSIDKAVIDKRMKLRNLRDLLGLAIIPRQVKTEFFYPVFGIGSFCERLAEGIKAN